MGRYSIKDLEQLSGIKAHTIRIWEQRYNLLAPERTDTNIRYYSDQDLRLILNVSLLKEKGYKISRIIDMGSAKIAEEVLHVNGEEFEYPSQIHALTISMLEINEEEFEKVLSDSIKVFGFESAMVNIVYPFLERVGLLWQAGTINTSHEHFITNLVRQKIFVAIDGLAPPSSEDSYMLFLPEGELHEITLLFCNYLLRARNKKVIYLGQSLPFNDLITAWERHKPKFMFSVITNAPASGNELQDLIKNLSERFAESRILIAGVQLLKGNLTIPSNVKIINSPAELLQHLED